MRRVPGIRIRSGMVRLPDVVWLGGFRPGEGARQVDTVLQGVPGRV